MLSYMRLQPLHIPSGWLVAYNNGLYEIDPDPAVVHEADRWWLFKQDMLQMWHEATNRLLDLGWYPEGDLADGGYGLVVYDGEFPGQRVAPIRHPRQVSLGRGG